MKKKKGTIGIFGFGRFGTLAASVLSGHADVFVYHYKHNGSDIEKAKKIAVTLSDLNTTAQCDIVILAVPISQTQAMIKKVARAAKPGALIVDTCSVKVEPCRWLKQHVPKSIEIMGTHPMFGPVTTKFNFETQSWQLKGLQMVLCPLRISDGRLQKISSFLSQLGLETIITTPENHDLQNAKTLGLVHFLGRALNGADIKPQEIYTPGYTDLLRIMPHTTSDNWQLFYDMHNYNHYADKVRKRFMDTCEQLEERIERSREKDDMRFLRNMIDRTDQKILELLEKRFEYASAIGKIKKKKGLAVVDKQREEEIIEKRIHETQLDDLFIKGLYSLIFKEAYKRQ